VLRRGVGAAVAGTRVESLRWPRSSSRTAARRACVALLCLALVRGKVAAHKHQVCGVHLEAHRDTALVQADAAGTAEQQGAGQAEADA
jgi:hypothetical protein